MEVNLTSKLRIAFQSENDRKCGYTSNDDRVGAMNIYELGKWFVSGIEKPSFVI